MFHKLIKRVPWHWHWHTTTYPELPPQRKNRLIYHNAMTTSAQAIAPYDPKVCRSRASFGQERTSALVRTRKWNVRKTDAKTSIRSIWNGLGWGDRTWSLNALADRVFRCLSSRWVAGWRMVCYWYTWGLITKARKLSGISGDIRNAPKISRALPFGLW